MQLIKKSYHRIRKINIQKPALNHSKKTIKRVYYKSSITNPTNTNRRSSKHKITLIKLGAWKKHVVVDAGLIFTIPININFLIIVRSL